jgi:hypothetical protein
MKAISFGKTILFILLPLNLATGCATGNYPDTGTIITQKTGTALKPDYDNGDTIFINVKIAIDEEGWKSKTPDYFKTELKKQWAQITNRFNTSDKRKQLKRYYVFKPDLENIFIYSGCSYWNGKNGDGNGADNQVLKTLNKNIFKTVVIYDFFYNGADAGEYGGGCGNSDGINTILVINASEDMKNKYNDHFGIYTYRAITHELGHSRGCIDLYSEVVDAKNNPVSHEGFTPPHCIMNDMCYTDDNATEWSDYATKIINKAGNLKINDIVNKMMLDYFAKTFTMKVTKNNTPVNAIVKFYPVVYKDWTSTVSTTPRSTFTVSNGSYTIPDLQSYIFSNDAPGWGRWPMFLVEASVDGIKKYQWLTDYMMQVADIDGNENYNMSFNF